MGLFDMWRTGRQIDSISLNVQTSTVGSKNVDDMRAKAVASVAILMRRISDGSNSTAERMMAVQT